MQTFQAVRINILQLEVVVFAVHLMQTLPRVGQSDASFLTLRGMQWDRELPGPSSGQL